MAITSEDIENVEFSFAGLGSRGYDVDEVDVFLDRVAKEVDELNKEIINLRFQLFGGTEDTADDAVVPVAEEAAAVAAAPVAAVDEEAQAEIADLRRQVTRLEDQLAEKNANDSAISQALIVAQRAADDIVANAKNEASNIIKDADDEADRIVDKAESDRQRIIEAIRKLEGDRASVRNGYREMLQDFVLDAQHRLSDIESDARREAASAQARASQAPTPMVGAPVSAGAADPARAAAMPGATQASAAISADPYVEKDFSGYGDADADFDFDDLD